MSGVNGSGRFPYVLFDLGSTLIYFEGNWASIMAVAMRKAAHYLRSIGYDLDMSAFLETYFAVMQGYSQKRLEETFLEYTSARVLEETFRKLGLARPSDEEMLQALRLQYSVTQEYWHVEPDAVETLRTLRERGYHLGIISNASDDEDVQVLVDNANLREYFDFILSSAKAGVRKPNPQIFLRALSFWEARPEQAVMVGDLILADVVGANALGMSSVWITRRGDTPENQAALKEHTPKGTIFALSELTELLENW